MLKERVNTMDAFSQVALVVKNLPANARGPKDMGSIPGSGRSPGEGHGNPFQYSCPLATGGLSVRIPGFHSGGPHLVPGQGTGFASSHF